MIRKAFHQVRDPVFDPSVRAEIRAKSIEFGDGGQTTEEEKIGGLDKRALFGKDLDPKPPVFQDTLLAIKITDSGFRGGNPG
jgi:hypothetical protein